MTATEKCGVPLVVCGHGGDVRHPRSVATIAVIGAGSWGTALAKTFVESGHEVTLWAHGARVAEAIATRRENTTYLPGIVLPAALRVTSDLAVAVRAARCSSR